MAEALVVTDFVGVEGLMDAVRGGQLSPTQLGAGQCSGTLMHANLAGMTMSAGMFRGDVRVRGVMNPTMVTVGTILHVEGSVSQWDYDVTPGDICIFPHVGEQEGCFRGTTAYTTFAMPLDELVAAGLAMGVSESHAIWSRSGRHRGPPELRRAACEKIRTCLFVLQSFGPQLSERGLRLLREEVVETFLAAVAGAVGGGGRTGQDPHGSRIVRLVEDYFASGGYETASIAEVCRSCGISRRTLHRAFHDVLGVGPKTYLRLMRLSAARRALILAQPGATVTSVALDNGFWELGRFAALYRATFGEHPSTTLRRSLGQMRSGSSDHPDFGSFFAEGSSPFILDAFREKLRDAETMSLLKGLGRHGGRAASLSGSRTTH